MAKSPKTQDTLVDIDRIARAILDYGSSIILSIDDRFRIHYINQVPAGLTVSEVLGTSCLDYVSPEHHQTVQKAVRHVIQAGEPTTYEIQSRGAGDSVARFATRVLPLSLEGHVPQVLLITDDISEMKRHAQAFIDGEVLFRALVKASADVVYRMSADWSELIPLDGFEFVADTVRNQRRLD
jgi:PAS domain S-box-containing protein